MKEWKIASTDFKDWEVEEIFNDLPSHRCGDIQCEPIDQNAYIFLDKHRKALCIFPLGGGYLEIPTIDIYGDLAPFHG